MKSLDDLEIIGYIIITMVIIASIIFSFYKF